MPDPLCHATNVYYNGIVIRNVLTESLASDTVYDRANVDPIGIKTRMVFTAEVYGADEGSSASDAHHGLTWTSAGKDDLAYGLRNVIDKFLQPRKALMITMGNYTLFDITASQVAACDYPQIPLEGSKARNQDIDNGPRTTAQVLGIMGDRSAKCRFSIEFTLPLPCGAYPNTADILNVRWRVNDDIECQTWLTRRTYEGVIRFRTRFVNPMAPQRTPHYIARLWCLPPLLRGFRRESISYHEDPNALEISFVIVDQELYSSAPSPATFWDGTYTMTLGKHAAFCTQDLSFVLKGDKSQEAHKAYLMQLAMYIIDAKMAFRINRPTSEKIKNRFLVSAMFQERLNANELRVGIQMYSTGADAVGLALSQAPHLDTNGNSIANTFTYDLPESVSDYTGNPRKKKYDPEITTMPPDFSAGVSLLLAALQTPCCPQEMGAPSWSVGVNSSYQQQVTNLQPATMVYDRKQQLYDEKQSKASYAYYKMTSDLIADTGWRAFPIGKQCNSAPPGNTPSPTVAFAHLHCPVQIRKVTINAQRINAWPELPKLVHWKDTSEDSPGSGILHVLKAYAIEPLPVQTSADGCDSMHEVQATYYYYLDRPYEVCSQYKMPVGRLPYVSKKQLADTASTGHEDPDTVADKRGIDQSFFLDPKELLQSFQ